MTRKLTTEDAGRAMIEVVFLAVLILIPTVYILASVMRIQAATFAVAQGARDAGRVIDSAPSLTEGVARAEEIAQLALTDQRVPSDGMDLRFVSAGQRLRVEPGDRAQPATRRCLRRLRGGCRFVSGCAVGDHRQPEHRDRRLHAARRGLPGGHVTLRASSAAAPPLTVLSTRCRGPWISDAAGASA